MRFARIFVTQRSPHLPAAYMAGPENIGQGQHLLVAQAIGNFDRIEIRVGTRKSSA
jgi:hypothetical protein